MQPITVIFIGPQGSGKGTQIEKIRSVMIERDPARRVVDIQTGRRFRALAAKHETFAERKISETLDTGALQPDFLTHILWGQAMIDLLDPQSHLLIDGFPRTVHQAHVLDNAFSFFERNNVHIMNLDTPEDIVRERMYSRARADDTAESIETRLHWYRKETVPVLEYYRMRPNTVVHDLVGTDSIDGVHQQVLSALGITV
jgi:adenylate kinase